jgi:short-subunit dehydrogenase involved in D-alanine esterification of teichoic acids/threonine dehydrogenase-like Zn-dependent dehydrogenase
MKAIGVFEFGGPEKLQVVDLPRPEPGAREIRIRVHGAGVNPTDALFRSGSRAAELATRPPPYVPVMDASGFVDAIGPDTATGFSVGDPVIAYVIPTGPHGGAYAEEIVVPAASVVAAPRGATLYEAASLLLNGLTARLALDALALSPGETIAVTGAPGAVGGYAIQLAKTAGLRVIGDAGSPSDEALVRRFGADWTLPRGEEFVSRLKTIAPSGVRGLIDGAHLDGRCLSAIADGGTLITLRRWAGPSERDIAIKPIVSTLEATNTALLDGLRQNVEDGVLSLRVAAVLPAWNAADAHRRFESGGVRGRLVLDFAGSTPEEPRAAEKRRIKRHRVATEGDMTMKLEGNTVFITGGGSGIGRALAEALHKRGNQVIIAGRRKSNLAETVRANPGLASMELDVADPSSILAVAKQLVAKYPTLNVFVNNAGVMAVDDVAGPLDDKVLVSTIATNVLGPMRLTAALIGHFKQQRNATVINISSVLGFVPLAWSAVYSSTKAAMHSYSLSLRYRLKDTSVKVVELAPPWVQTDLLGSENRYDPRAMPLDEYTAETMRVLEGDVEEVLVERAKPVRNNVGPNEGGFVRKFNDMLALPS